jgi:hypothetical protein
MVAVGAAANAFVESITLTKIGNHEFSRIADIMKEAVARYRKDIEEQQKKVIAVAEQERLRLLRQKNKKQNNDPTR